MRILVVGVGKVGKTLAESLTQEQHDVVLIDNDEAVLRRCACAAAFQTRKVGRFLRDFVATLCSPRG